MHWVVTGDALDVLPKLGAATFDSVVTDPPYGLSFRGHDWDGKVPGLETWRAVLRVAKPGAFMLVFGGTRTHHRLACAVEDAGWEIRDCISWLYGQGFPKSSRSLKPGWEPIYVARRPTPNGPALQIDACRIPVADQKGGPAYARSSNRVSNAVRGADETFMVRSGNPQDGLGRWPANVVLDEEAAALLDAQSGQLRSGFSAGYEGPVSYSAALGPKVSRIRPETIYADTGGASRFFYCAKAAKSERTHNGAVQNKHATVKPIALMRWLVTLVTPPGGRVLDPFCGSGTTGLGCGSDFAFVGIEQDAESAATARARLATLR